MDKHPRTAPKPVVLCILDGWGYSDAQEHNALSAADLPVYRRLWKTAPKSMLATSGLAVGLPEGQMGNSEVGHMNIGGGRVMLQDLPRIDAAIADGTLASNPRLLDFIASLKASGGTAHLLGLLSPGGVHAHQDHMAALARECAAASVPVAVHAILDGRDTPPRSALDFLATFESAIADLDGVAIATVTGRYFAMDRDQRWDRVEKAHAAMVSARGHLAQTARDAVEAAYARDENDEFVGATVIDGYDGMADGDGLLMANFRADRAREILACFVDPAFDAFERGRTISLAAQLGMVEYSSHLAQFIPALFPPEQVANSLGEVISGAGLRQLRIAETEKYAHVTFFFNGGQETVFDGEDRILVPSPKVATYDLKPEMSAPEVTDKLVEAIGSGTYDLIVVNYANPDMVGHTGDMAAAIKAVEAVDACLGRLETALVDAGGVMLVTADHGNVEMMRDPETGQAHTAHTTFDVPVVLMNAQALEYPVTLNDGRLADLAPTVLDLMGLRQPDDMTGQSLLEEQDRVTADGKERIAAE